MRQIHIHIYVCVYIYIYTYISKHQIDLSKQHSIWDFILEKCPNHIRVLFGSFESIPSYRKVAIRTNPKGQPRGVWCLASLAGWWPTMSFVGDPVPVLRNAFSVIIGHWPRTETSTVAWARLKVWTSKWYFGPSLDLPGLKFMPRAHDNMYIRNMYRHVYIYIYTYIHTLHYITLHYTRLHYITLHLHYIALHCITLHYITLHYITLHYIHIIHIIHIYVYIYIHIHIHTYIYIYVHTDVYLFELPWNSHMWSQINRLKEEFCCRGSALFSQRGQTKSIQPQQPHPRRGFSPSPSRLAEERLIQILVLPTFWHRSPHWNGKK